MKQGIRISKQDNVATLLVDLSAGEMLVLEDGTGVQAREAIPYGHKIALNDIPEGSPIRKYNEIIGLASEDIVKGQWVHVHNCRSARGGADR